MRVPLHAASAIEHLAEQEPPDPGERVTGVPTVPEGVLLDPAADLAQRGVGQLHDVNASSTQVASGSSVATAVA